MTRAFRYTINTWNGTQIQAQQYGWQYGVAVRIIYRNVEMVPAAKRRRVKHSVRNGSSEPINLSHADPSLDAMSTDDEPLTAWSSSRTPHCHHHTVNCRRTQRTDEARVVFTKLRRNLFGEGSNEFHMLDDMTKSTDRRVDPRWQTISGCRCIKQSLSTTSHVPAGKPDMLAAKAQPFKHNL